MSRTNRPRLTQLEGRASLAKNITDEGILFVGYWKTGGGQDLVAKAESAKKNQEYPGTWRRVKWQEAAHGISGPRYGMAVYFTDTYKPQTSLRHHASAYNDVVYTVQASMKGNDVF